MNSNLYVLNPDIAVPEIVNENEVIRKVIPYDMPYKTVRYNIEDINANYLSDKYKQGMYTGPVFQMVAETILKILEIIKWQQTFEYKNTVKYFKITKIISKFTWNHLSVVGKQFYIPLDDIYSERYQINEDYGKLLIPPRGSYSKPRYNENIETVIIKSKKFKIPARCTRMLVRLRDGSVLELYAINFNYREHIGEISLLLNLLKKSIQLEPVIAKQYMFSKVLTTELGRPAYNIPLLLQINFFEI